MLDTPLRAGPVAIGVCLGIVAAVVVLVVLGLD